MKLRGYCAADCPAIMQLFYDTVHIVNARDYTPAQLAAWAPAKLDTERWEESLAAHYTVVAEDHGQIVGFGDITADGYLDRLYVHKDHQGRGIASRIVAELERYAAANGIACITTAASLTARSFFAKRGYQLVRQQSVERGGEVLINVLLEKKRVESFFS